MRAIKLLKNKKICWYPSAGSDFRDLLMINEKFLVKGKKLKSYPDIYVHTSIGFESNIQIKKVFNNPENSSGLILYSDEKTNISVISAMRLENENIGFNEEFTTNPIDPRLLNNVLYLKIKVESNRLGIYEKELVYFVSENGCFAINYLLKNRLFVTHITRICYGDGFGGAKYNGDFIFHILSKLKTQYIICNSELSPNSQTDKTNELLKENKLYEETPKMRLIVKTINQGWSNPLVDWYEIIPTKQLCYILKVNNKKYKYINFNEAILNFRKETRKHILENDDVYSDFVPDSIGCLFFNKEQDGLIDDEELIIRDRLYLLMNTLGLEDAQKASMLANKIILKNYNYSNKNLKINIANSNDIISVNLKNNNSSILKSNAFIMNDFQTKYYFISSQTIFISKKYEKLGEKNIINISLGCKIKK